MILRFTHNNQPPIKTRFSFLTGIMSLFLAVGLTSCGVPQENDAAHSDAGDTGTTADGSPLDLAATSGGLVRPTGSFGPTPNEANCPYCAIKGIGEALPPMQPTRACAPFFAANTCYSVLSVSGNSGKPGPLLYDGGTGGFRFNNPLLDVCIAGEIAYPGDEVMVNGTNLSQTTSLVVGGRTLPFTVKEIPSSPRLIEPFKRQGLFFTLPRDIAPGFYPVSLQNSRNVKPYVEPDNRRCATLILEVPERIRIDTVTPLQARVGQFVSLKGTGGLKVASPDNIRPSPEIVVFFGITDEDPIGQMTRQTKTVSNSEVQVVVPFGAKRGKIKIRVGCIESTSQQIFTPLDALPPSNIRPVRIGFELNSGRQTVSPLSSAAIGNWIAVTGDRLLDCTDVAPGPAIGNGTSIGTFLYNRDEGQKCGDPVIGTDRYPLKYLQALQGLNQNFPPQAGTKVFFTSIDGWVEGRLRFDGQGNYVNSSVSLISDRTTNLKILLAEVPPTAISGPIRLVTPCGGPIQSSSRLTITPEAQTPMPRPTVPAATAPVIACGGSTSCYDQADAKRSGKARLPSGREITLVQGVGSFQVWREKDGVRILAASGLEADGWQKKLRRNGREFTQEDFTNVSVLAGRICLGHVYNFANNQSANPKCVYYSKESDSPISFWQPGQNTGIEGEDYFGEWRESSWYHGNISQCSNLGMRLPILREMAAHEGGAGRPKEPIYEATRLFGQGIQVPANKFILTATVFDPPSSTNFEGNQCSQSDFEHARGYPCRGDKFPGIIQFEEAFASSTRARSMYWVAVNTSDDRRLVRSDRSFPMFYFPGQNGEAVAPVHALCVLPSSK